MLLFLGGDLMTGRGIDQVLPAPCDPTLHEDFVRDARVYVELAERASGPIARPRPPADPWGDLAGELDQAGPDARIVNLETSITRNDDFWPGKAVHYRMSPENAACLTAGRLDVCALANNHVLDWGRAGLDDTIATLDRLAIGHAGAGRDHTAADAPAIVDLGARGRVLVFAVGSPTAGVPPAWAADDHHSGVALLPDLTMDRVRALGRHIAAVRRARDVVVLSIHWGPNWGYDIDAAERRFAAALIDEAGVDVVHGHSSHHVKGIEVHRGRPILYGCGELLDDYEGIRGYEEYRADLGLAYLVTMTAAPAHLERLTMIPIRIRSLRITRAGRTAARWLRDVLSREGRPLGTRAELGPDGRLELRWT